MVRAVEKPKGVPLGPMCGAGTLPGSVSGFEIGLLSLETLGLKMSVEAFSRPPVT